MIKFLLSFRTTLHTQSLTLLWLTLVKELPSVHDRFTVFITTNAPTVASRKSVCVNYLINLSKFIFEDKPNHSKTPIHYIIHYSKTENWRCGYLPCMHISCGMFIERLLICLLSSLGTWVSATKHRGYTIDPRFYETSIYYQLTSHQLIHCTCWKFLNIKVAWRLL